MQGIAEVALAFDAACRESGISYAFMGAMAVMVWGEPRATTDVDAMVVLPEAKIASLVTSLRSRGFSIDPRDLVDAVRDGGHVSAFPADSPFWVDIKVARKALEMQEVASAIEAEVRGARLRLVSAEETIAFKLSFGSPKDLQDVQSILVRQGDALDRSKLAALVATMGVAGKLKAVERDLETR